MNTIKINYITRPRCLIIFRILKVKQDLMRAKLYKIETIILKHAEGWLYIRPRLVLKIEGIGIDFTKI